MTQRVKTSGDGRSTRWDDHRDQRRAELVEAAVAAIDRHGPDASIADIAGQAGVSKPVLYRYFADKAELHAAIGSWAADEVLTRALPRLSDDAPIRTNVAAAVDAYLESIAEHPQVFWLLVRHRGAGDPLADGKAAIAAGLARIIGDGLRSLGVDAGGAEPWAHGLVGLGLATGEWWLSRETMSRPAVAAYLTSFIWHAFEGFAADHDVPLTALDEIRPTHDPDHGAATPIRKDHRR